MRDTLLTVPGVQSAEVDFRQGRAVVVIDSSKTQPQTVAEALGSKTKGRYTAKVITK